ncbi:hypothetical protein NW837_10715, partial [Synechococcus sp. R6-10]|uniref:hypothetical protein n=1 Tax=Synechococcus sp. R6-10 TaxID=2291956 RepID=UPI0039C293A4
MVLRIPPERGVETVEKSAQNPLRARLLDAKVARKVFGGERNSRRCAGKPSQQAFQRCLGCGYWAFYSEVPVSVAHEDKKAAVKDDPSDAGKVLAFIASEFTEVLFELFYG